MENRISTFDSLLFRSDVIDDFQFGVSHVLPVSTSLKIFKNFGLNTRDSAGKRIPVDDPRFDKVFAACGRLGIPVLIHTAEPRPLFEPMDKHNERWIELKRYPRRARPPEKYPGWESIIAEA